MFVKLCLYVVKFSPAGTVHQCICLGVSMCLPYIAKQHNPEEIMSTCVFFGVLVLVPCAKLCQSIYLGVLFDVFAWCSNAT